jgi:hypothetical protein
VLLQTFHRPSSARLNASDEANTSPELGSGQSPKSIRIVNAKGYEPDYGTR